MGAWDVTLYGGDAALDVRGGLELWLRIPGSADELVAAMTAGAPASLDPGDEDYPTFWLALADQFHRYGIAHAETFRRARQVIEGGLDLAAQRALGLDAEGLAARGAMLQGLLAAWSHPHPRPRRRKLLSRPEPHAFPVGAVLAYPTGGGEPRNYADTKNRLGWAADGWGSAVVLAQGHARGWFAWSCFGRLSAHGAAKPTFAACLDSAIENQPGDGDLAGDGLAIAINALSPAHARRMGFERLGQASLDPDAVARLHPAVRGEKRPPFHTCFSVVTWWADGVWPRRAMRRPDLAVPRPAVALRSLLAP